MSGKSTGRARPSRSRNGSEGAAPSGGAESKLADSNLADSNLADSNLADSNLADSNRANSKRTESRRARPSSSEATSLARSEDIALVCGLTDDGQGVQIIRKRGERLETGTVRKLEAGKPIHGEVVRLRPRSQTPLVCDVEVEFDGATGHGARREGLEPTLAANSGPAQVATESYRKNWDAVYGRSRKPSLLN